jgi:pimeloyl-ACP methyl ester carboxylesterase
MTTYVLIHGAWHGAWCWHRVVAGLERASHRVIAPDLRSLGRDRTPPELVTLDMWTEQIVALAQAQPDPIVLVGHSRGGIVLSEVAERVPKLVRTLVYVTAFMLDNGRTLLQAAAENPESLVGPAMVPSADGKSVTIRDQSVRNLFYGKCSDEDVVLARSLLVPEPTVPLATPIHISPSRYGSVPRVYVECSADRALTLDEQRRMQAILPCRETVTLDSDHSPFFCRSEELVAALQNL